MVGKGGGREEEKRERLVGDHKRGGEEGRRIKREAKENQQKKKPVAQDALPNKGTIHSKLPFFPVLILLTLLFPPSFPGIPSVTSTYLLVICVLSFVRLFVCMFICMHVSTCISIRNHSLCLFVNGSHLNYLIQITHLSFLLIILPSPNSHASYTHLSFTI